MRIASTKTKQRFLAVFAALTLCPAASAQTVRIGVFGLFHPAQLGVRPGSSVPLRVETNGTQSILEGNRRLLFQLAALPSGGARISAKSGGPTAIVLEVPGRIERRFEGVITILPRGTELTAIVTMELETAVASVVAAEIAPSSPIEALKAQAVVARSFLISSPPRHRDFQFCDTTHCQFLRSAGTARRATLETQGLQLTFGDLPFAPLYSAACGGHTRSLRHASGGYSYRSVPCEFCLRHARDPVRGHRLGMCQSGASAMAARGAGFREILNHYYPGAAVAGHRNALPPTSIY